MPGADTILKGLDELKTENTKYVSDTDKNYNFNINKKLNRLNIKSLKLLNELEAGEYYDFYYDNQITPNTRLRDFIFKFISIAGKWVFQGRRGY